MGENAIRRPRRISLVEWRDAPAHPKARQADRFQRALKGRHLELLSERPALGSARRTRSPTPPSPRSGPAGPAEVGPYETALVEAAGEKEGRRSEPLEPSVAIAPPAEPSLSPILQRPDSSDEDAAADCEPSDGWTSDLVRVMVLLCVRTDPATEAWSIVMPLDARRLPHTELYLALSRHLISLRFLTHSAWSMRLLLRDRATLATLLERSLPGDREITIEVT